MKSKNLNLNFLIGIFLMLMPALFFFSVVMERFFGNNFLVENIFVPIDKTSGLISAFIMVGLPFIAICINILTFINVSFNKEKDNFLFKLEIKPRLLNILIACLGFLTIVIIIGYLFTENFLPR